MADGSSSTSRRDVLVGFATLGAAAALGAGAAPGTARARAHGPPWEDEEEEIVLVSRLSSRNTQACRACRIHHRYVIATSHALANANRAHPGCNCPIRRQAMSRERFDRLFPDGEGVVDLRQLGEADCDKPRHRRRRKRRRS